MKMQGIAAVAVLAVATGAAVWMLSPRGEAEEAMLVEETTVTASSGVIAFQSKTTLGVTGSTAPNGGKTTQGVTGSASPNGG